MPKVTKVPNPASSGTIDFIQIQTRGTRMYSVAK